MRTRIATVLGLAALMAVMLVSPAFAVIDYTTLTDGLTSQFESGVTMALPVIALMIGAFLVVKTVRRFAK